MITKEELKYYKEAGFENIIYEGFDIELTEEEAKKIFKKEYVKAKDLTEN